MGFQVPSSKLANGKTFTTNMAFDFDQASQVARMRPINVEQSRFMAVFAAAITPLNNPVEANRVNISYVC